MSKARIERMEKIEMWENKVKKIIAKKRKGFNPMDGKELYSALADAIRKHKDKPGEENMQEFSEEDRRNLEIYDHQIDNLVGDECILCGNIFIETLDMPFDSPEELVWTL